MARSKPSHDKKAEIVSLVGLGLDNTDGHRRITRAEDFLLLGGSSETHEKMQDVAIHFTESLQARGKRLQDAEPAEISDLLRKAIER